MMRTASVILFLLASACSLPPARNPFEGAPTPDERLRKYSVAIVLSPTTVKTLAFAQQWNQGRTSPGQIPDLNRFIEDDRRFLALVFKSAVIAGSRERVSAQNTDVIAVLDLRFDKLAETSFSTGKFYAHTLFVTPRGAKVDEATGVSSFSRRGPGSFPNRFYSGLIDHAVKKMQHETLQAPGLWALANGAPPVIPTP